MKKIGLSLLYLLALQNYAFSQNPLSKFTNNSMLMFGPTWNNWMEVPSAVKIKASRNIGFDVAAVHRFGSGKLGLVAGLGISAVNIHSNVRQWTFDVAGNVPKSAFIDMDSVSGGKKFYSRNKIALTYLEVPLELNFRIRGQDTDSTNAKTGFKFAIGVRPGICIDAHTKLKTTDQIVKIKDFDNIARFRFGPTVRIGYGGFSLYGRYDLTSSFEADKVPVYALYTVGLVISSF
jgi:hypothetical protein